MNKYINILIFFALTYVIIKHFLMKNKESSGIDEIDKIIREKKIAFGNTDLSTIESKSNSELDKILQWGDQDLGEFFSTRYFDSHLIFELSKKEVLEQKLNLKDRKEGNYLFTYLMNSYLKNKKNIRYKKVSSALFKLTSLLILGVEDRFFKNFKGQKKNILEFSTNKNYHIDNYDDFIKKVDVVVDSTRKFFLLSEVEALNVSKAYSKKELAKMYHPDQMDLNLIPEKYRDQYFKIYSEQFSKLISHQS